jgi:hypothetical protein
VTTRLSVLFPQHVPERWSARKPPKPPKPKRVPMSPEERKRRNSVTSAAWRERNRDRIREYDRQRRAQVRQILVLDSEQKRERAAKIVSMLPIDKPLKITVEPYRAKRSNTANARLWLLHQKAAEATGMSADEMHEIALARYYGYEEKTVGGITRQIPLERSSTKDTKAFAEFMEATEAFYIAELGVFLD